LARRQILDRDLNGADKWLSVPGRFKFKFVFGDTDYTPDCRSKGRAIVGTEELREGSGKTPKSRGEGEGDSWMLE